MTKTCECGHKQTSHTGRDYKYRCRIKICPCKKFKEKIDLNKCENCGYLHGCHNVNCPKIQKPTEFKYPNIERVVSSEKTEQPEFNLSEKISQDMRLTGMMRIEDIKTFIKKCDEHSFTTDEGLRVIDMNKLKELAGDSFK